MKGLKFVIILSLGIIVLVVGIVELKNKENPEHVRTTEIIGYGVFEDFTQTVKSFFGFDEVEDRELLLGPDKDFSCTYYVDANGGSGGSGTLADPFHRQGTLGTLRQAGAVYCLMSGNYGNYVYDQYDGDNLNWIYFTPAPGAKPVFNSILLGRLGNGGAQHVNARLHFNGIEVYTTVDNSVSTGVYYHNFENLRFTNMIVHGSVNAPYTKLSDNCGRYNIENGFFGFGGEDNVSIENTSIYDFVNNGVTFHGNNFRLVGGEVHGIGIDSIYLTADARDPTDKENWTIDGVHFYNIGDCFISVERDGQCGVVDFAVSPHPDIIQMFVGNPVPYSIKNIYIKNNLMYYTCSQGIFLSPGGSNEDPIRISGILVENNTLDEVHLNNIAFSYMNNLTIIKNTVKEGQILSGHNSSGAPYKNSNVRARDNLVYSGLSYSGKILIEDGLIERRNNVVRSDGVGADCTGSVSFAAGSYQPLADEDQPSGNCLPCHFSTTGSYVGAWSCLGDAGSGMPYANAGDDKNLIDNDQNGFEQATLDGSESTDDGTIVNYNWSENGIVLYSGSSATVDRNFNVGVHNVNLEITDNDGNKDADSVTITVNEGGCIMSSSSWQNFGFAAQTGMFTVTFNSTPNNLNLDGVTAFSFGAQNQYADFAMLVRFNGTDNVIDVRDGTSYRYDARVNYAAGTRYSFRIVVNVSAQKYDVFVKPEGGSEVQIANDYVFRGSASSINNCGLIATNGNYNVCGLNILTSGSVCGNNVVEPGEACDGNSRPCSAGEYDGVQNCNATCGFDSCTASEFCGDGIINGNEECDGNNIGTETCESFGFPGGGTLKCLSCDFDNSLCSILPSYSNFDGNTTNFTNSNVNNVSNATLERVDYGLIYFSGSLINFSRLDLNSYVVIDSNLIGINLSGAGMNRLNVSAFVSFYNISFVEPKMKVDGADCLACAFVSYVDGIYTAKVPGFSYYNLYEGYSGGKTEGDRSGGSSGGTTRPPSAPPANNTTAVCTPDWKCGEWSVCLFGIQRRTCLDANKCGVLIGKPEIEKPCGLVNTNQSISEVDQTVISWADGFKEEIRNLFSERREFVFALSILVIAVIFIMVWFEIRKGNRS